MSIAAYIKVIGRGKDGARPLNEEQSHDLLSQVLDGRVTDLEVGAFALAMRIKGETVAELAGFLRAAHERCLPLPAHPPGVVVLASYNGARKLPNLTPLLAGLLAQRRVAVLVHGNTDDPTRVSTAHVWASLGWPVATQPSDISAAWAQGQPVFMDLATLCPSLSRLLAVRWTIGLRNPGHTVAKLLNPWGAGTPTLRVVNHTHPEYADSLTEFLQHSQANALLMRGTEGEPVADARRQPRFEVFMQGERRPDLGRAPEDGVMTEVPELPPKDAAATAAYVQDMLSRRIAPPASIAAQAACLHDALRAVAQQGPAAG